MNEKKKIDKEVKKPDSLIVTNAQSELWQIINKYSFPLYLWELIVRDLYLESKSMYEKQVTKDMEAYNAQLLKECESQEEGTNKSDDPAA